MLRYLSMNGSIPRKVNLFLRERLDQFAKEVKGWADADPVLGHHILPDLTVDIARDIVDHSSLHPKIIASNLP